MTSRATNGVSIIQALHLNCDLYHILGLQHWSHDHCKTLPGVRCTLCHRYAMGKRGQAPDRAHLRVDIHCKDLLRSRPKLRAHSEVLSLLRASFTHIADNSLTKYAPIQFCTPTSPKPHMGAVQNKAPLIYTPRFTRTPKGKSLTLAVQRQLWKCAARPGQQPSRLRTPPRGERRQSADFQEREGPVAWANAGISTACVASMAFLGIAAPWLETRRFILRPAI